MKRFLVEAYPSIYLVKAGKVYVFEDGARSEQEVKALASLQARDSRNTHSTCCSASERSAWCLVQFEDWALRGYQATEPLSAHRSPVSAIGRTLAFLMRCALP